MNAERKALFARAEELGLKLGGNTSNDNLKKAIAEAEATAEAQAKDANGDPETGAKAAGTGQQPDTGAAPSPAAPASSAESQDDQGDQGDQGDAAEGVVVVQGPERGRWRIGRKFTRDEIKIPRADLSDDDVAALVNDPELIVSIR